MKKYIVLFILIITSIFSCQKVTLAPPANQLTPDKVFDNVNSINAATSNIYTVLQSIDGLFISNVGVYTDELITKNVDAISTEFANSNLTTTNSNVLSVWTNLYSTIYKANAVIEGIQTAVNIPDSVKNQCLGEAKFMRGYSHFLLTNIYGNVPLITSTDPTLNRSAPSVNSNLVYSQIISDLKDAISLLYSNYPGSGEKIRANKWVACALLAKVYLYNKDYTNAQLQASAVINSGKYSLNNLNNVFLANNSEAIFQCWNVNGYVAFNFIPSSGQPIYSISPALFNSFETGDNRKTTWLKSTVVSGNIYYYPYKYRQTTITTGANAEYVMHIRLADMYLIRAEASTYLNQLASALSDLNLIRSRAGLSNATAITQTDIFSAISHERQVEFFTEDGNRFFDLKRSGTINSVLGQLKPLWKATGSLYPIPFSEITIDHNLIQNPGYNN